MVHHLRFLSFITKQATPGSTHSLVVYVKDDLRGGKQLGGNQSARFQSEGCMYTRTTGIWQIVWMEAVDKEGLESVFAIPDIDQKQLVIHPQFYKENGANKLTVKLYEGKKLIATATSSCYNGAIVTLPVKQPKLWSRVSITI